MLTQHVLACFPLGSEKTPFTSLDLSSLATLTVGGKQSFNIRDQTHTTYHFFMTSQAEQHAWMRAFQQIGGLQRSAAACYLCAGAPPAHCALACHALACQPFLMHNSIPFMQACTNEE